MATDLEKLYREQLQALSPAERLRLINMLARGLAQDPAEEKRARDLMDLHGLGKEIWDGVDAEEYVNRLRGEWDQRPR
ncbi:MAG: hypothetical protein AUG51_11750 [Acidobacteria bacterium 13_1_20CM_3_53_8]|nr:MAG: hypothetical protein AUG51_11750 [Acidobacteria bacterium 13_1_20CM_3_53_8]